MDVALLVCEVLKLIALPNHYTFCNRISFNARFTALASVRIKSTKRQQEHT